MTVARSVLALVACMVLLASPLGVAQTRTTTGQPQGSEETHAPTRFDIDAQPLATALRAFSEAAGVAVLFDDALVAGRQSPGVHGDVAPRDALRILLVGTGLNARFSSMNAFTVTSSNESLPDDAVAPMEPAPVADGLALDARAAAVVQGAIERALCAHDSTRPGSFRLAMQLWIDSAGSVADVAALAPSDDASRDDRVLAALRSVRVPAVLHRFSPVTILLTPSAANVDPCRRARSLEG
jgi:hypothetical protein